jgi:flagellar biosynthesis/type III secretory pathway chaperone
MRRELADLHALLERQIAIQSALLALAHEKRRVIIGGDTQRLGAIGAEEMRLLSRSAAAEKERDTLRPSIAALLGLSAEDVTVGGIIGAATPEEAAALRVIQKELTRVLSALGEANAVNRDLLNAQLEYTEIMLNAIAPAHDPLNNLYGSDGRARGASGASTGLFGGSI